MSQQRVPAQQAIAKKTSSIPETLLLDQMENKHKKQDFSAHSTALTNTRFADVGNSHMHKEGELLTAEDFKRSRVDQEHYLHICKTLNGTDPSEMVSSATK